MLDLGDGMIDLAGLGEAPSRPVAPLAIGPAEVESGSRLLDQRPPNLCDSPGLAPFLKWPGGKSHELPGIALAAPPLTGRYIDPFVGGGSILLAVPHEVGAWANDAAEDLIELYRGASQQRDTLREAISGLARTWQELGMLDDLYGALAKAFVASDSVNVALSRPGPRHALEGALAWAGPDTHSIFTKRLALDLPSKFDRMRAIQVKVGRVLTNKDLTANVEGAVRSAFYMSIRARYNRSRLLGIWNDLRNADFYFLREFSYAAMFRFNSRGEFNVPYGGVTYNRKSFAEKAEGLYSSAMLARLGNTEWRSADFDDFLTEAAPAASDFVFVDPPYDSDFSAYDNRPFGANDQERLRTVLECLSARVMLVIKDTPTIRGLYRSDRWHVAETDKTYMWTIKSRNDREAVHLTITNY